MYAWSNCLWLLHHTCTKNMWGHTIAKDTSSHAYFPLTSFATSIHIRDYTFRALLFTQWMWTACEIKYLSLICLAGIMSGGNIVISGKKNETSAIQKSKVYVWLLLHTRIQVATLRSYLRRFVFSLLRHQHVNHVTPRACEVLGTQNFTCPRGTLYIGVFSRMYLLRPSKVDPYNLKRKNKTSAIWKIKVYVWRI